MEGVKEEGIEWREGGVSGGSERRVELVGRCGERWSE